VSGINYVGYFYGNQNAREVSEPKWALVQTIHMFSWGACRSLP